MRLSNFEKDNQKDNIEITKQQEIEILKVFESRIRPHENHTLFEIDLKTGEINPAVFDEVPAIKWEDAVKGNLSSNRKITKREGCIYVSSLNKENVKKILKRDFNIELT